MLCIRIFNNKEQAEFGQKILKESGIYSVITEDTFNNVPIQNFGVRARYRLHVNKEDFLKTADLLAKKVRANRIK